MTPLCQITFVVLLISVVNLEIKILLVHTKYHVKSNNFCQRNLNKVTFPLWNLYSWLSYFPIFVWNSFIDVEVFN